MWVLVILVVLFCAVLAFFSQEENFHEEFASSFADLYKERDRKALEADVKNAAIDSQKDVGQNVADLTHRNGYSWDQYRKPQEKDRDDDSNNYNNRDFLNRSSFNNSSGYSRSSSSSYQGSGGNSNSGNNSSSNDCEVLNLFVVRETAISNMMAAQFTSQQKSQLQDFMNALNNFMAYVQQRRPDDADNLVRTSVPNQNNTMVDAVVQFARSIADKDVKAKNLILAYEPIAANIYMTAYIQTMLLSNDLSTVVARHCR